MRRFDGVYPDRRKKNVVELEYLDAHAYTRTHYWEFIEYV